MRTPTTRTLARVAGALLALLLAAAPTAAPAQAAAPAAQPATAHTAQPAPSDPLGQLGTRLENVARQAARIATPIAIMCIILVLLMYLFAPLLPEVAQQHKGYIIRALVIVAFISFVPEIVRFAGGLGAASGS